jgi:hypothetical protein
MNPYFLIVLCTVLSCLQFYLCNNCLMGKLLKTPSDLLVEVLAQNEELKHDVDQLKKKCNYLKRVIRKYKQEQGIYERKRSVSRRQKSETKQFNQNGSNLATARERDCICRELDCDGSCESA